MLSFFLASVFALASPLPLPTEELRILPDVHAVLVVGGDVVLVHDLLIGAGGFTCNTSTVPLEDLVLVPGGMPNAFGWPPLATPAGPQHELETSYASSRGTHTIRTNCRNYLNEDACVRAHARQLDAMQQIFRPV